MMSYYAEVPKDKTVKNCFHVLKCSDLLMWHCHVSIALIVSLLYSILLHFSLDVLHMVKYSVFIMPRKYAIQTIFAMFVVTNLHTAYKKIL